MLLHFFNVGQVWGIQVWGLFFWDADGGFACVLSKFGECKSNTLNLLFPLALAGPKYTMHLYLMLVNSVLVDKYLQVDLECLPQHCPQRDILHRTLWSRPLPDLESC